MLQVGTQLLLVGVHRDPRLGECGLGDVSGVHAIQLEGGLAVHGLAQRRIAHAVAEIVGALGEQRAADQAFQHLVLQPRTQRRRQFAPSQALLPHALLAQPGVARILDRDLAAVRFGGVVRAAEIQVHNPVGAPGGEYHRERTQNQVSEQSLALQAISDPLQHVSTWLKVWRSGRDSNPRPPA